MNDNNGNQHNPKLKKQFAMYVYAGAEVDYKASLLRAYEKRNLKNFARIINEPECSDEAIAAVTEKALHNHQSDFIPIIAQSGRLTPGLTNTKLMLASYEGDTAKMAVWMAAGADIHYQEDRALMCAILGVRPDAIIFLVRKGCVFNDAMNERIQKALNEHDLENAPAIRRQVTIVRSGFYDLAASPTPRPF